ncbi:TcaA NTF2-like domain-containing protein [Lysinibacillus sp. FSL M8-0355]|uniref:TcaA NTF2-like domain-containing protein n=1 Tax=Lysinibacillus sp. FSL M8-0355 TaxID=2921719 RepID=UPI0030F63CF1
MKILGNFIVLFCLFLLTGCSEKQSEYNLDQLDGPAAALVESWRADGISDDEILKRIEDFMNADGTELYYDEESKERIERLQKYKLDGTEHTLKEFMDLLNEQTVWSDIGFATDLVHTQAEYPINFSEEAHIVDISENSKEPEFKLLMYVDDDIISVYKIKSNESEAFNQDAEAALKLMYENKVNPQGEEAKETESSDKQTVAVKDDDSSSDVISQSDVDSIPVPGANNTTESARDQIGYLVTYYLQTYVNGDIASLGYYVYPSSAFYLEQERYMQSLKSKGNVLDLIDYNVTAIEQLSEKKYEVNVVEYYTIDNPEQGFSDTEQNSKYTVEIINGDFYITGLEIL